MSKLTSLHQYTSGHLNNNIITNDRVYNYKIVQACVRWYGLIFLVLSFSFLSLLLISLKEKQTTFPSSRQEKEGTCWFDPPSPPCPDWLPARASQPIISSLLSPPPLPAKTHQLLQPIPILFYACLLLSYPLERLAAGLRGNRA